MDVRQELLRRFAAPLPEYYTRRIVVFRDDQGGFAADVEQMELPGVRILIMRENEWFTLRRQIESDYAQENICLLYTSKSSAVRNLCVSRFNASHRRRLMWTR